MIPTEVRKSSLMVTPGPQRRTTTEFFKDSVTHPAACISPSLDEGSALGVLWREQLGGGWEVPDDKSALPSPAPDTFGCLPLPH